MIFDIDVIDDEEDVIFQCSGIELGMFNKYFIESCQISENGAYWMKLNDYKHAIVRIYEANA